MKKTITEQLRELGFTPKEIKKINNHCVYDGKAYNFTNLSHVEIHEFDDAQWLHLFAKNEWYGFLCMKVNDIKGE